jgi:hypothetical protein
MQVSLSGSAKRTLGDKMNKFKVGDKVVRLDGDCHSDGSVVTTVLNVETHQWMRLDTGASLLPNGKLAYVGKYRVLKAGARHIHAEFIEAWADGYGIEYYIGSGLGWTYIEVPSWVTDCAYRIALPKRTPQEIKEDAIKVKVAALQEEIDKLNAELK